MSIFRTVICTSLLNDMSHAALSRVTAFAWVKLQNWNFTHIRSAVCDVSYGRLTERQSNVAHFRSKDTKSVHDFGQLHQTTRLFLLSRSSVSKGQQKQHVSGCRVFPTPRQTAWSRHCRNRLLQEWEPRQLQEHVETTRTEANVAIYCWSSRKRGHCSGALLQKGTK
jgi:hypothetical protein